jgi:hypothetical protein
VLTSACTTSNPAYEATGAEASGDATGAEASTSGATQVGSVDGPTSSSSGNEPSASGETSAGDEGPPVSELCLVDLYGISEAGVLYLIDVDEGTAVPLPADPELGSWAIASDPADGTLYINPLAEPSLVRVVEPVTFTVLSTLTIAGAGAEEMARAGFDPDGGLWFGTFDTNQFFRLQPAEGTSDERSVVGIGAGGDLVFLDSNRALVPSLLGDLSMVDFSTEVVSLVPVMDLPTGLLLTGLARDVQGRLWVGSEDGQLLHIGFRGPEPDGAYADQPIDLGVTVNDLAPMVEPPGC